MGSRTPALLFTRQEWAGNRRPSVCARLRSSYLLHIVPACWTSSVQQINLPVRTLDPHVDLADLPRENIRLTAQFRDRKANRHQLGPELPADPRSPLPAGVSAAAVTTAWRNPRTCPATKGVGERAAGRMSTAAFIRPMRRINISRALIHLTGFRQQLGGILGGRLPLLVPRTADDACPQLLHASRRLRTFCQCLASFTVSTSLSTRSHDYRSANQYTWISIHWRP
ncbi:hypothetical protein SMICM17S_00192 [Streptomyces microflavus]